MLCAIFWGCWVQKSQGKKVSEISKRREVDKVNDANRAFDRSFMKNLLAENQIRDMFIAAWHGTMNLTLPTLRLDSESDSIGLLKNLSIRGATRVEHQSHSR